MFHYALKTLFYLPCGEKQPSSTHGTLGRVLTHYTALALQQPGFKSLLVPDPTCKLYPGITPGSLWAVLLSLTPQKQKQRKAIKVELCVFCESQSNVCLCSQGSRYSGLQSRQALFDPWKERGKLSCSKPSSVWGESTFSQQLFSFYHCRHLQLPRGCDANSRDWWGRGYETLP